MKIFGRVDDFLPATYAGSEVTLFQELRWLAARGHEVTVLAEGSRLETNIEGVQILRGAAAGELKAAQDWCDVLITQQGIMRRALNDAAGGPPVVILTHNEHQLAAFGVRPGEAALVVYNSFWLAKRLKFLSPGIVVHPPVTLSEYETIFNDNERDGVMQVNLSTLKGGLLFWWLAQAMPELSFLGVRGTYGDQHIPTNLPTNAKLLPSSPDPRDFYRRAHILLMPSSMETYGRVALEAACSGIPAILSPTPGLLEAMGRENALWADPTKPGEWMAALTELGKPQKYNEMSERALARAVEVSAEQEAEMFAFEAALLSVASTSRARVWAVASEPHYVDHLAPQLHAVDPSRRGVMLIPPVIGGDSWRAAERAMKLGLPTILAAQPTSRASSEDLKSGMGNPDVKGSICLIVSERDYQFAGTVFPGRLIRGEHGAGQTYDGLCHHSFPGGPGHATCLAATAPNASVAAKIQSAHPQIPVAPIGCPKLAAMRRALVSEPASDRPRKPRVVFSFRYPGGEGACPELGSAWAEYATILRSVSAEYDVGIHVHPRAWNTLPDLLTLAQERGWRVFPEFWDVLTWADLFAVDNSSIALEWLSLRKSGLVLLDSSKYRRWVVHGLRFWAMEMWPGVHICKNPDADSLKTAMTFAMTSKDTLQTDWYLPEDPARLRVWLQGFLRPTGDQVRIKVRVSCDGQAGRLKANSSVYVISTYAAELEKRGMASRLAERAEPTPIRLEPPSCRRTWASMRAQEAFSWYCE